MKLLIVTGQSGAGKSTALAALEDVGFSCVDNLPVALLPAFVDVRKDAPEDKRFAVGVDARENRLGDLPRVLEGLEAAGHEFEILFFEAPHEVLVRRFSETRRRHPCGELPAAIDTEWEVLEPLRARAAASISTAHLKSRDLRLLIRERYASSEGPLKVALMSFGFKNGVPAEADLIFDVRFLPNPYDIPDLRPLTGFDDSVFAYVMGQEDAQEALDRIEGWLRFQAPRALREGRSVLTLAVGCTGGQHRSVSIVRRLDQRLTEGEALTSPPPVRSVRHRDIPRVALEAEPTPERKP